MPVWLVTACAPLLPHSILYNGDKPRKRTSKVTKFNVVGAGMAGLLAGAVLRDQCEFITELQSELPNNHSALLRFRSSVVGDALNIPFRKVKVMKGVVPYAGNPVGDALSYSLKTNGTATLRSSISANGAIEERFIAPENLIYSMAEKVTAPIHFGQSYAPFDSDEGAPTISTIPMPMLMRLLKYQNAPEFRSVIGYNLNVHLKDVDVCATLYYPDPKVQRYRASITGDRLTIEYCFPGLDEAASAAKMVRLTDYPKDCWEECHEVLRDLGIPSTRLIGVPEVKLQRYGKLVPIDEGVRKRFMMWATDKFNIYSLGRFATWRPGLLMDDLINDIRVIQRIADHGGYDHRKS